MKSIFFWELLPSARPEIYYSTLLLPNQPCPQQLGLQLPVELDRLRDLSKGHFSGYTTTGQRLSIGVLVLTSLGSLQLFLKLGFLFFKALDLLFHLIKFSHVLTVSFIKLVPCSESFIKTLGNFCILLCQGVPIVYSLIQSMRLQERPIGNILQTQHMICQDIIKLLDIGKDQTAEDLSW